MITFKQLVENVATYGANKEQGQSYITENNNVYASLKNEIEDVYTEYVPRSGHPDGIARQIRFQVEAIFGACVLTATGGPDALSQSIGRIRGENRQISPNTQTLFAAYAVIKNPGSFVDNKRAVRFKDRSDTVLDIVDDMSHQEQNEFERALRKQVNTAIANF